MKQESTFGPHVNDPQERILHKENRKKELGIFQATRLTSNEEFNKDAEYMQKVKAIFMRAEQKWRDNPTDERRAIANIVKRWAFKQKKIIQTKTWG